MRVRTKQQHMTSPTARTIEHTIPPVDHRWPPEQTCTIQSLKHRLQTRATLVLIIFSLTLFFSVGAGQDVATIEERLGLVTFFLTAEGVFSNTLNLLGDMNDLDRMLSDLVTVPKYEDAKKKHALHITLHRTHHSDVLFKYHALP